MLLRLAELGWLYRKVRHYCDQRSSDSTLGLIGQSFLAALQQELTEYYRLLAVLEAQLHSQTQNHHNSKSSLTLHRLVVWTLDPHARLKALASLVDVCKGENFIIMILNRGMWNNFGFLGSVPIPLNQCQMLTGLYSF